MDCHICIFVHEFKIDKSDYDLTSNFGSTCIPRAPKKKTFNSSLPLGQLSFALGKTQFALVMIILVGRQLA